MALTFCTFGRALKTRFNIKINNHDFVNLMLAAVPVDGEKVVVSKNTADKLMGGHRQVPTDVRDSLRDTNKEKLAEYFKTFVIQYIDEEKRPHLADEILDLAADDVMLPESEKSNMEESAKEKKYSLLLAHGLVFVLMTENANPDMFIHRAPALEPWDEMPDYSAYLKRIHSSFSSIRTLLYYETPKPFYDFYVCNTISMRSFYLFSMRDERMLRQYMLDEITDATIKKLSELSNYVVIMGTGGLGKSMMMRNLLLCSIRDFKEDGMIPVFVPLKDYQEDDVDLFNYVYDKFTDGGKHHEVTPEQFEETLRHNRIQLLLDGYDEIKTNCVDVFETALRKFMRKYPNNFYIISSRPFDHIVFFKRFLTLDLTPFSKEQSLQLIDKLEFRPDEPSIKQKFAQQLEDNLYKTHREFASNPLLLTIMLMTFEQYAEVPSKMHVFYREAYATLSQKHDASKGAYKRALHTGLSADRFADYFAEFCARTYRDEKYEMTEAEIIDYFDKLSIRKKASDANFGVQEFIYDLRHNLCLLYRESGKYHFTHRSFQEYFCAVYYSKQKDRTLYQIGQSFERRKDNSFSDKTFHMLYDMIPEKVEEYIFLPVLKELFNECEKEDGYWTYLSKDVGVLIVSPRYRRNLFRFEGSPYDLFRGNGSFLRDFILRHVIGRQQGAKDIEYPYHKDFVVREYDVYEQPDGHTSIVPSGMEVPPELEKAEKRHDVEYRFKFDKIARNKEAYPELVTLFEREDYPTRLDYEALKSYYEKLKAGIEDAEDDSLDFLD